MQQVISYNLFMAFAMFLEDTGNLHVHMQHDENTGMWTREFRIKGVVMARDCKLTRKMAKIPWQDRYHGDHLYVNEEAYEAWVEYADGWEDTVVEAVERTNASRTEVSKRRP